jgi:hypothetical protein
MIQNSPAVDDQRAFVHAVEPARASSRENRRTARHTAILPRARHREP